MTLIKLVAAAGLLCFGAFAQAQTQADKARQQLSNYSRQVTEIRSRIGTLDTNIKTLQDRVRQQAEVIRRAEETMQRNKRVERVKRGWWNPEYVAEERFREEDFQAVEEAKKEHERLKGLLYKEISEHRRALNDLVAAEQGRSSQEKEVKEAHESFRSLLGGVELETKFSDLNNKLLNTAEMIGEIERHFDRSVMAVYLRDKFNGLLNSGALCDMVKETARTGQCPAVDAKKLDTVFNGVPSRARPRPNTPPPARATQ